MGDDADAAEMVRCFGSRMRKVRTAALACCGFMGGVEQTFASRPPCVGPLRPSRRRSHEAELNLQTVKLITCECEQCGLVEGVKKYVDPMRSCRPTRLSIMARVKMAAASVRLLRPATMKDCGAVTVAERKLV